ncbi:MAG TPA: PAC2 family protein [Dehalococcoidia bacterium]|jgi:proteasome assembly chaperone (PAC2) family protein
MGFIIHKRPKLTNPVLVACWPGIGNIGIMAVDLLRRIVGAEELGEIEPWDFFYPKKVLIANGELKGLEFPENKFYFKKTGKRDLLFFIGEEQPSDSGGNYAEGTKAYKMANLVLDVAQKFGCHRVYTSGAAVAPIHHTTRSRVWVVPNSEGLLDEIKDYENTVLMSEVEGRSGQGNITGLNGLLLGVAKKRGLEAVCIMGEIPIYVHGFPIPYPKGSKAVLEVLSTALGVVVPMDEIDGLIQQSDSEIESVYEKLPTEIKEQLDKLKYIVYSKPPKPITEEDKKKILQEIDKLFRKDTGRG